MPDAPSTASRPESRPESEAPRWFGLPLSPPVAAPGVLAASRTAGLEHCGEFLQSYAAPAHAFRGDELTAPFDAGPPRTPLYVTYNRRAPQRGLTGTFENRP